MPDDVFCALLKNLKKAGIRSVHFTSNSGDPLMAPNFLDKVKLVRQAGVRQLKLTTNGIMLDAVGIDALLASGINSIIISTSPFTALSYKRLYRSSQFERMRNNVMNLLTKNKLKGNPVHITISINSDMPRNEVLELADTRKLIELADDLAITEAYGDWLGSINNQMLHGTMHIEKPKALSRRPCRVLLFSPAIYPNGDIAACICRNIHNDPGMYLGNIKETDLDTAIKNLENIARRWIKGGIPKTCNSCTMYQDPSYYWPEYLRRILFTRSNKPFRKKS